LYLCVASLSPKGGSVDASAGPLVSRVRRLSVLCSSFLISLSHSGPEDVDVRVVIPVPPTSRFCLCICAALSFSSCVGCSALCWAKWGSRRRISTINTRSGFSQQSASEALVGWRNGCESGGRSVRVFICPWPEDEGILGCWPDARGSRRSSHR